MLTFSAVLSFADAMLFVCALVNILGLYLLLPVIKAEMVTYLADRKSGALAREASEPPARRTGQPHRPGLTHPHPHPQPPPPR